MASIASFPKQLATTAQMFDTSAQLFNKAVAGLSDDQWLAQPGPDSNHLLWIAGHLIVARGKVLRMLGQEWSAPWESLFSRGAAQPAPDSCPRPDEIQRAWKDVSERLPIALAHADSEFLSRPAAEGRPTLDGTVGGTISFFSFHESYHLGQMGYLRKWLGQGQVVG